MTPYARAQLWRYRVATPWRKGARDLVPTRRTACDDCGAVDVSLARRRGRFRCDSCHRGAL